MHSVLFSPVFTFGDSIAVARFLESDFWKWFEVSFPGGWGIKSEEAVCCCDGCPSMAIFLERVDGLFAQKIVFWRIDSGFLRGEAVLIPGDGTKPCRCGLLFWREDLLGPERNWAIDGIGGWEFLRREALGRQSNGVAKSGDFISKSMEL